MAVRRMFSNKIVESDAFLDMPPTSQLLYFHLCMYADDEGFVSPRKIMRMIGSNDDDIKILIAKRFVLAFESGVVVVKHWLIHNTIRMDRFNETSHQDEKKLLKINKNKSYTDENTISKPMVNQMATKGEHKLSKVKLSEVNLIENTLSPSGDPVNQIIGLFEKINPTINYANKTNRSATKYLVEKFSLEKIIALVEFAISVQGNSYAPVITTPYQLKEKLARLKIYADSQSNKTNKFEVGKV